MAKCIEWKVESSLIEKEMGNCKVLASLALPSWKPRLTFGGDPGDLGFYHLVVQLL